VIKANNQEVFKTHVKDNFCLGFMKEKLITMMI